ncbi:AAA family ATPase [Shimia sp. R11_0]|uniref:ATP-dependent nuclease n=1 Tax=Shimia sp. R11_0 TaxID=2821096 RepID=UPI001ADB2D95|nr:AAA family ATPase [Shimia sp. R11_0]MBO9478220.1 AAA family ATPase [Shimia sp. R11_0]
MPGSILIENLKGTVRMEYSIPNPGVHLLSGSNGSGKTTLLACLRRIGFGQAFPVHFPSSSESHQLDDHGNAKITYEINGRSVAYGYRGERWTPLPRRNANVLNDFGYASVVFAGATAERITPSAQDFTPARIRNPDAALVAALNTIFDTQKFSSLKEVNLTTGAGNKAFLLRIASNPTKYHTEKNFGLGELCVLKLIRSIMNCPNNSLILIDELEMALHPKAQIKFVEYLKRTSAEKNLTILVSTHSATLIKYFGRGHLTLLQKENDRTEVISRCYPTYALGHLGFGDERAPDTLIYVEDGVAREITEALIRCVISRKFGNQAAYAPTVHYLEGGGILNVINLLNTGGGIVPAQTKVCAFLDLDAKTETLQYAVDNNDLQTQLRFQNCEAQLRYLPWTPEVGVAQYLSQNRALVEQTLREKTGVFYLNLNLDNVAEIPEEPGPEQRRAAKNLLTSISSELADAIPNWQSDQIRVEILRIFSDGYFHNNTQAAMQLFGPVV